MVDGVLRVRASPCHNAQYEQYGYYDVGYYSILRGFPMNKLWVCAVSFLYSVHCHCAAFQASCPIPQRYIERCISTWPTVRFAARPVRCTIPRVRVNVYIGC